jgi:sulfur-oxidizing protein SoxX
MRRLACALAFAAGTIPPVCAQDVAGPQLFTRADKGHCIACHQVPAGAGPATRSDLGPALAGERMRLLGKPTLRMIIADPMRFNPATVMPPYGRHNILSEREIARLADYLHALP